MGRLRIILFACAVASGAAAQTPDPALSRFAVVVVAPVQTSVYVGRVSLAAGPFLRRGGSFSAGYAAQVFPFFFYSEQGTLRIDLADEALRRLLKGATVRFTGTATRADGLKRQVDGRAAAAGADRGILKVRLHVNSHVVLVFDTTYRLSAAPTPSAVR